MLRATGLVKRYGGVTALDHAGIEARPGEIHALVGENGAGKSTLVKILSGVVSPDAGRVTLDGAEVRFGSPRDAAAHGIAIVAQELSLFPDLTVAENLFIRSLPRRAEMSRRAAPVLAELGLSGMPLTRRVAGLGLADRQLLEVCRALLADPAVLILDEPTSALPAAAVARLEEVLRRVAGLGLADRQLLEVCRALLADPAVLILDEPTSALPAAAVARLEEVLRRVAGRGIAVLFISHFLEEVRRIADRVSVLRDGRAALSGVPAAELSLDDLVHAMLGAATEPSTPSPRTPIGGPGAGLAGVSVPGRLDDVTLTVAPGEIVGVTGLEGAGHLTVLELIAGLARPSTGVVRLPGGAGPRSFRDAVRRGVAYVPGDRRRLGLMLDQTVWENATAVRWLGAGAGSSWRRRGELIRRAEVNLHRMRFRGDVRGRAGDLSGGNQQKVVFAKWLDAGASVLVLDDPTRGVDVGARGEMHDIVRELAGSGRIVLLASTDLAELTELCHRVLVLQRGRIVGELAAGELTEQRLSTAMNAGFAA
jgi:ABC-type sugar transport system ATPase subunit